MLLSLTQWLATMYPEELGFLRVVQYLTFRAVLAALRYSRCCGKPADTLE